MPSFKNGSLRLFRFAGIDVFLHWAWFLVAAFEISNRTRNYSSPVWNVLEYLTLFLIVMVHEFGHALACRQVGGIADRIMLWPLGGVAYVDPPPRPGATLWSIAAGPLVNVALIPILKLIGISSRSFGWAATMPDAYAFLSAIWFMNWGLLIFNLLPIYPLDGGQILRSLLWFVLGRARSLMAVIVVGFAGVAALIGLAMWLRMPWFGILSVYILMNCWRGLQQARALLKLAKLPRRDGFACPTCNTAPAVGAYWVCNSCNQPFDTFQSLAACPNCSKRFSATRCMDCGRLHSMEEWASHSLVARA
jgi:Zn-dependent protease